jgi:hypothetical protein
LQPITALLPLPQLPAVGPLPFFGAVGIVMALMLTFQLLTGRRYIKLKNFKYHRWNGTTLFFFTLFHVAYALHFFGII